jgi:hypothetical protein
MMQRVMIEFVVDVPNAAVAGDVETRIGREHHDTLCEMLKSVTGYVPLCAPGQPGLLFDTEFVTWDAHSQEWINPASDDDDADDDDDDED